MRLSKLTHDDIEFVRCLRNAVRLNYIDQRHVSPEQQEQWFARINADQGVDFRIVIVDGKSVGYVSLTRRGDLFEVGVNIAIEHRRKGYGKTAVRILTQAERTYFARILPHNLASQALFRSLGFQQMSDTEWKLLPLAKEG